MADLLKLEREMGPERSQTLDWLTWLRDVFQIVDGDSLDKGATLVKSAKARWNELEAKRKELTGPLLDVKKGIDALFKATQDPLAQVEKVLKDKIGAFAAQERAKRIQAMQVSAEVYQAGGTPTDLIPAPVQVQGITAKQVWRFTVVEPDLVPRDLCSPDPAKIKDRISYADTPERSPQPIPGLSFHLEDQVAVRTGKVST